MTDFIILDIEFNGRKFASDLPMEVIEIGAVRLNANLAYIDEFEEVIKPRYFSKLNSFIRKKTGIPQEAIDKADDFPKVSKRFMQWLERSEDCLFITWGGEDFKRIVLDTRMHEISDSYWTSAQYLDLLKAYLRVRKLTNDVSLENALIDLDITSTGSAHRALDDAKMTAHIFTKLFNELDLNDAQQYKDMFSNAKERRLVRNAIRAIRSQKLQPDWELVVKQLTSAKVSLEDERKVTELKEYYDVQIAMPMQNKTTSAEAGQTVPSSATHEPENQNVSFTRT